MILLQQMSVLFIIMLVGFIANKKGFISHETSKKISTIVVNIANPALVISGTLADHTMITKKGIYLSFLVSLIVYTGLLVIGNILPVLLRVKKSRRNVYKAMTIFSNIGFMGFPIIASVYGNGALLYGSIFVLFYSLLIYTYGLSIMRLPHNSAGSAEKTKTSSWTKIFNVGVIACVIALTIFFTGIQLPGFMVQSINMLSSMTAPLSMLVIGASFGTMNIKELVTDWKLIVFSLVKLIPLPLIGTLILYIFIKDPVLCGVTMIVFATPVGSMTAMLAQEFDGDYELASKGIAVTTVLSVATIPLVSLLLSLLNVHI